MIKLTNIEVDYLAEQTEGECAICEEVCSSHIEYI